MQQGEKRKQVYFSLEDESDRTLYEFAKTINFSQFAKRFLQLEYDRRRTLEQAGSKASITLRPQGL